MKQIYTSGFYNSKTWTMISYRNRYNSVYVNDDEIVRWCQENGSNDRFYVCGGGYMFENERDATLFVLRWGSD